MAEVDVAALRRQRTLTLTGVEDVDGNITSWVVPPPSHDVERDFWKWWDKEQNKEFALKTQKEGWAEVLNIAVRFEQKPDGTRTPVDLDVKVLLKKYDRYTLQVCAERTMDVFFAPAREGREPERSENSQQKITNSTSADSPPSTEAT